MAIKTTMTESFELGPIRPPSEAYSLLIRVTRNCPWNRCKFCPTYKGEKFELRSVEEIKREIKAAKAILDELQEMASMSGCGDSTESVAAKVFYSPPSDAHRNVALWLHAGGKSVFLQDANTLIMKTDELVEIIRVLKETFPSIDRITSYARSKTAARKSLEELIEIREAGLSRLHIGLETGYDPLLQYMDKGVTAAEHIAGGTKVVESGISLCEYVVLGLGGRKMWREHAIETARVLSEINPDFIRVRTLTINSRMPLHNEIDNGSFIRAKDEEILEEERLLLEHLECHSNYISDHVTNLLQEIEGQLPQDKEKMLAIISRFQALSPQERADFRVGRRIGIYNQLDDFNDIRRREVVEQVMHNLSQDNEIDEKTIYSLMEGFI